MGSRPGAATALALLALTLAGCGKDTETLAELRERADRICRGADRRLAAIRSPDDTRPATVRRVTRDVVRVSQRQLDQLRRLTPPAEAKEPFEDHLRNLERQIVLTRRLSKALIEKDADALTAAEAESKRLTDADEAIAKKLGFRVCGTPQAQGAPQG